MPEATARRPGRPRSEAARQAVLATTTRLGARDGYRQVTIEGIARDAGVSKQTVYRWWSGKAAILLEALNEAAAGIAPRPDTGSIESDVGVFLRNSVAGARRNRHLLAALMAEAQLDADLAVSFGEQFLARRRGILRDLLERGRHRGELAAGANPELLAELAFAMLWYRILARRGLLNQRFAEEISRIVLRLGQT